MRQEPVVNPPEQAEAEVKVTTLELFFDLVFVFTITQVTGLVVGIHHVADLYQAFVVLAMTWYIYAGYVWLANNINLRLPLPRLLILTAMAGFLVMALAIPRVFGEGGVAFGLAYLLVVSIHSGLFTSASNASSRAIWYIAPYNLAAAGVVLVAGLMPQWGVFFWTLAVLILISSSLGPQEHGFVIRAAHFAERHGLVILIVLGESLIAIGNGAEKEPISLLLILAAVLGLSLSAALWWSYFDRDDVRAEHALSQMSEDRRAHLAANAYGYAHLAMIAGIVVMAAGIKQVIAHVHEPYPAAAWTLGAGVAIYLFGDVIFRRLMGIGQGWLRLGVGVLALLTVAIGLAVGGLVQLAVLVALLVGMLMTEHKQSKRHKGKPNV